MHRAITDKILGRIFEGMVGDVPKGIIPGGCRGRIPQKILGGVSEINFEEVAKAEVATGGISEVI